MDANYTARQACLVDRLKRLMLIHSYLYYVLNDPIISDAQWQAWADELTQINRPTGFYDEYFKDWDGTTGYHLPQDGWIISTGLRLRRLHDKYKITYINND